jgi:hypothetical protein
MGIGNDCPLDREHRPIRQQYLLESDIVSSCASAVHESSRVKDSTKEERLSSFDEKNRHAAALVLVYFG